MYTDKELQVISAFNVGFNYTDAETETSDNASAVSVAELSEKTGLSLETTKGVVGSLTKKNLLVPWSVMDPDAHDSEYLYVTEDGIRAHYDNVPTRSILCFERPAKLRTTKEHNDIHVADGAPPGTYVPNMTDDDAQRWKARHVNAGKEDARIEIRKTLQGTQIVLVVALDGWNFAHDRREPDQWGRTTLGRNVRLSMNGPARFTFDEFFEMSQAVEEARSILSV